MNGNSLPPRPVRDLPRLPGAERQAESCIHEGDEPSTRPALSSALKGSVDSRRGGFCVSPALRFCRTSPARRSRSFPIGFPAPPRSPAVFRNATTTRRKCTQGVSHSRPRGPAGVQSPRLFPRPARVSLPPIFPLAVLLLRSALLPLPCDCPLIPLPRLPTKKRAKFPPRVFSCGPDAAAVHRRIRTCIQNEARRASRS